MVTLSEVFGQPSAALAPLAYVYRAEPADRLLRALYDGTHVSVFGTPGVGKTTLLHKHVDQSRVLHIECQKGQNAPDVYRSILATAGARIQTERKLTKKRRLGATLKLFSGEAEHGVERTETDVTIDLGNVTDVFRTLLAYTDRRHVVLNNFSVLRRSTQRVVLRNLQYVFEQTPVRFILVGTWTSGAYLTDLSETLPSFMADVPVPAWTDDEASALLDRVEELLGVAFADEVRGQLISMSAGSVRELSETCRALLAGVGVDEQQRDVRAISADDQLQRLIRGRTAHLFGKYRDLLSDYLTISLATLDGVDQEEVLLKWFGNAIVDDEDGEGEHDLRDGTVDSASRPGETTRYTMAELEEALAAVVQEANAPVQLEQQRRRSLVEMLRDRARQDGSHVSVSFDDVASAGNLELFPDLNTLRSVSRSFVSAQKDAHLHPALVTFDRRSAALVALEPKFRAFLRAAAGDIGQYERTEWDAVDYGYGWVSAVTERAYLNRWRNRHTVAAARTVVASPG